MTVCVDANAWIYFLDADLPEHPVARPAVENVLRDRSVFTTTVLQMEVIHYLVRHLRDP